METFIHGKKCRYLYMPNILHNFHGADETVILQCTSLRAPSGLSSLSIGCDMMGSVVIRCVLIEYSVIWYDVM